MKNKTRGKKIGETRQEQDKREDGVNNFRNGRRTETRGEKNQLKYFKKNESEEKQEEYVKRGKKQTVRGRGKKTKKMW